MIIAYIIDANYVHPRCARKIWSRGLVAEILESMSLPRDTAGLLILEAFCRSMHACLWPFMTQPPEANQFVGRMFFSGTVNLISTLHACHRRTVGRYCLKPTFQPFFFIIGFTFIKEKKNSWQLAATSSR